MAIMAIDPGLRGGVCVMDGGGKIVTYRSMPVKPIIENGLRTSKKIIDIAQVAAMIARFEPSHCFIEKVHAMPGQGVSSMFTFGMGYGMLLGLTNSIEAVLHTELVTPQRWQKALYANCFGFEDLLPKARAAAKFRELWPELVADGVSHDGIIDAALIAEYGRRILGLH